jgi:hypothetical protein
MSDTQSLKNLLSHTRAARALNNASMCCYTARAAPVSVRQRNGLKTMLGARRHSPEANRYDSSTQWVLRVGEATGLVNR